MLWRERVQPMSGADYNGAADAMRTRCFAFVFRICFILKTIGTRLRFGKGVFVVLDVHVCRPMYFLVFRIAG